VEKGTAGSGVRLSAEMVTGSAKSSGFAVKSAKALWRSAEAGKKGLDGQSCALPDL
jgi:hypothetical protein